VNVATPKVFISYRREETAGHAGRLYDAIGARFGERNVFMDVDLAPGIDFVEQITEAVGACDALLVVMGPTWATTLDDRGHARLADPNDFVRLELETALRRPDVRVIPLLVAGARMPDPDDLPESVRALARRNALGLSDLRWRDDVRRLVSTLDALRDGPRDLAETAADDPPAAAAPARRRWLLLAGAALAVGGIALAATLVFDGGNGASGIRDPALIQAGHRLVAQRSLTAPHSLRYTVALSVPRQEAVAPLTMSLLAARGREPLRLVERKPLPDPRFAKDSYVTDFTLDPNGDGSAGGNLSWRVVANDSSTAVNCYFFVSLGGISGPHC
jgi:TIR domain